MNEIEILLIILGIVAFIASFLVKGKSDEEKGAVQIDSEIVKDLVEKEIENAKDRVNEVVDETLEYAVEKTERASERISNEKIMAISEYSETVLADINKSHQEVMFLYDMLNEKHDNIKETVKQVDKTTKEITKEITEITKEADKEPEKDKEKFEVYSFAEKAPHIVRNEIAQQSQQALPLPEPQPQQEPVLQPQTKQAEQEPQPQQAPNIIEPVVVEKTQNTENIEKKEPLEPVVAVPEVQKENVQPINNNDRILEMHKAGIDSVDIAKELGLGVGEVKLVINLFKGAI